LLAPALRRPALVALGQLVFALAFPIYVGGDWMREFRFVQPAMGPLAALSALGLVDLVSGDLPPSLRTPRAALATAAAALAPPLAVALALALAGANQLIGESRDVGMRRLATVAARYREIGHWARLPRPPL